MSGIQKAHVTWSPTSLGATFQAYYVQRQHPAGWFDIAKITSEATTLFDDWEARRNVSEAYRVQVQDTFGIRSPASGPQTVTLTSSTVTFVSNEASAVNAEMNVRYPLPVNVPERAVTSQIVGRYGQRLSRSSDALGEVLQLGIELTGGTGPALWRTIVANLRSALSYICVLDPWGNRWFAGLQPSAVNLRFFTLADLTAQLVEVTDTPTVITI